MKTTKNVFTNGLVFIELTSTSIVYENINFTVTWYYHNREEGKYIFFKLIENSI